MFRMVPAILLVGLIGGCIDRAPLESRQCGECPPGVACVNGFCALTPDAGGDVPDTDEEPDDVPADSEDVGPDLVDVSPDLADMADTADLGPTCIPTGEEVCDGVDNDCDGVRDNLPGLGSACIVGDGACRREGVFLCDLERSAAVCSVEPAPPSLELCNGLDDDCDGDTDELDDVPGQGCDALAGASAQCEAGFCVYSCEADYVDANLDLGQVESDGCECQAMARADACDGLDNDCDGVVDPDCCDEDRDWSVVWSEIGDATGLVMASDPNVGAVVAWAVEDAFRYVVFDPLMRPMGPVVTLDQKATMLRVAASSTGFAVGWWDVRTTAMLVRLLDADGVPLDTTVLHPDLVGVAPQDVGIAYVAREDEPPRLAMAWALADCEGVCLRSAMRGEASMSHSFVETVSQISVSSRGHQFLLLAYTDRDQGGRLHARVFEPGVNQLGDGDNLVGSDGEQVQFFGVPTPDGWVVAFADQLSFSPLELFRLDVRGRSQRSRDFAEFSANSRIALVAPADHDRLGLLHGRRLLMPRLRYLSVNRSTLGVGEVNDEIGSADVHDLAAAALSLGVLVGTINDAQTEVRFTFLDHTGERTCP